MNKDSLKKRYVYKLSTNVIGGFINLFSIAIIPRALGVINFGNFNFITTIITQFINLLEFRTSTCFYTKLAQRPKENKLVLFYSFLSLLIFLILSFLIIGITFSPIKQFVFQDQSSDIIVYALFFVTLTWILEIFVKIMDAHGETVPLEKMRMLNKVLGGVLLVILYFSNLLNLNNYFYYQYFLLFILLYYLYRYLKRNSYLIFDSSLRKADFISYLKEFYKYSGPLGFYVILQFIHISFDRWILQYYGGSYQQGIYSFSFGITSVCLVFTTTMIPLFTRELSVAAGEQNIKQMASLYRLFVPMLYAITAYFCCFIFVESKSIIEIFGGKEYSNAELTLKILAFYPLVSVYSNLNGSVIYANGRTNFILKLALIFTPISVIAAWFLISNDYLAFNLGANGLALKELILELISVIILIYFNTDFLKLRFRNYLVHMIFSILPFIIFAYAAHFIVHWISTGLEFSSNPIILFFLSGIVYSLFTLLIVWFYPMVFGLARKDIVAQINTLFKRSD
jgi:O-antigen/teichoic acid export membrane protein